MPSGSRTSPARTSSRALRGQTAYDLVSARALSALIRANAERLRLTAVKGDLPRLIEACFAAPDPVVRDGGGGRGPHLRPAPGDDSACPCGAATRVNRAVRKDWKPPTGSSGDRSASVWLGGGLVSGALGPLAAQAAADLLAANGIPTWPCASRPTARALPVLGMARCNPQPQPRRLVFDFTRASSSARWPSFWAASDQPGAPVRPPGHLRGSRRGRLEPRPTPSA
jgi:hypothetical protein